MTRLITTAAAIATFGLAGLTLGALPAAAQAQNAAAQAQGTATQDQPAAPGGEKVNQLIIYGNDPCPVSAEGEITVCARKAEGERYRIPEPLRGIDSPTAQAWINRVQAYETVGAFGNLSCSPVGPGGASGCTQQLIDRAYSERANASDVRFSELIAAERQKRLSTIDADAAAQQKRVEAAEQAYFDQQKRQQATTDAAEEAAGSKTDAPLPQPK